MADRFRLTLAQLNPTVGDLSGNASLARKAWEAGRDAGTQLVALPEMFITGYNTQDLVMKPAFHQAAIAKLEELARDCADGPALAIGGPALEGAGLYNAYYILRGGRITARVLKHHLPNETVFDEVRIYDAAPVGGPYVVDDVRTRQPDLRGQLARGCGRDPVRDRGRIPAGAQRLALLPQQDGGAAEPDGVAGD